MTRRVSKPVHEEKKTVFVTEGDNMMGFYAARSMLASRKFEEVIVGVTDVDNEFVRTLENEGAIIKEWDLNSSSSIRQCLRDVDALVLVPHANFDAVEKAKKVLEVAKEEEELERLILWSAISPKSSNDDDDDDDNNDDDDDEDDDDEDDEDDKSSKRGSMRHRRRHHNKSRKSMPRGGKDHKNIERLSREIEQLVRKNYVHDWTICRIGFPIQSMFVLSEIIQNRGVIPLAIGEGEFAPVNLKDCGHATVKLVLECDESAKRGNKGGKGSKGEHSRQVYSFTGPTLLDGEKLAEKANRALGTSSLSFADVSVDEMRDILEKQGGEEINDFIIEAMLLHMHQIKKDELEFRTHDLEKLLKHQPLTVEKFFQENNDMFRPRGGRMVVGPIRDY